AVAPVSTVNDHAVESVMAGMTPAHKKAAGVGVGIVGVTIPVVPGQVQINTVPSQRCRWGEEGRGNMRAVIERLSHPSVIAPGAVRIGNDVVLELVENAVHKDI